MSDIASSSPPTLSALRKRPSNEMASNFPHAPSILSSPSAVAVAQHHHTSAGEASTPPNDTSSNNKTTNNMNNIVLLSLRDEYYRKIMWAQYNTLGRTRNTDREELVSQELFERFREERGGEGVCEFYKVERGGKRILVEEGEALDKITRDIKRRVESIHRWYGKSDRRTPIVKHSKHTGKSGSSASKSSKSSSAAESSAAAVPPSVSDHSDSSHPNNTNTGAAAALFMQNNHNTIGVVGTMKKSPPEQPQQLKFQQQKLRIDARLTNNNNNSLGMMMNIQPSPIEKSSSREVTASTTNTLAAYATATTNNPQSPPPTTNDNIHQEPTSNDIILSLYNENYRTVMFDAFSKLPSDSTKERKKEVALEVMDQFKQSRGVGRRYYKMNKGGGSSGYVEVCEKVALQKVQGDIGRRSETSKRWNLNTPPAKQQQEVQQEEVPQQQVHRAEVQHEEVSSQDTARQQQQQQQQQQQAVESQATVAVHLQPTIVNPPVAAAPAVVHQSAVPLHPQQAVVHQLQDPPRQADNVAIMAPSSAATLATNSQQTPLPTHVNSAIDSLFQPMEQQPTTSLPQDDLLPSDIHPSPIAGTAHHHINHEPNPVMIATTSLDYTPLMHTTTTHDHQSSHHHHPLHHHEGVEEHDDDIIDGHIADLFLDDTATPIPSPPSIKPVASAAPHRTVTLNGDGGTHHLHDPLLPSNNNNVLSSSPSSSGNQPSLVTTSILAAAAPSHPQQSCGGEFEFQVEEKKQDDHDDVVVGATTATSSSQQQQQQLQTESYNIQAFSSSELKPQEEEDDVMKIDFPSSEEVMEPREDDVMKIDSPAATMMGGQPQAQVDADGASSSSSSEDVMKIQLPGQAQAKVDVATGASFQSEEATKPQSVLLQSLEAFSGGKPSPQARNLLRNLAAFPGGTTIQQHQTQKVDDAKAAAPQTIKHEPQDPDNNVRDRKSPPEELLPRNSIAPSSSLETTKAVETTAATKPFNVILSLNVDFYKDIMWKHYKILGKHRDSEKEVQTGSEIFTFLKSKLGQGGTFFKRVNNFDVEVDEETALAKIIADIRRRMKNYRKWSATDSPEKPAAAPKSNVVPQHAPRSPTRPIQKSGPAQKCPMQPPPRNRPQREQPQRVAHRHPAASLAAEPGGATNLSPRRSTRKPTASEESRNKNDPSDSDVILSLNHDLYKEIMWRHYNILGRKQPGDKVREEEAGQKIFRTLKKSLGRSGRFFKKMSHGDLLFVVDNESALHKITRDLKRRNESIHKWLRADVASEKFQEEQAPQPKVKQPQGQVQPMEETVAYQPPPITEEHAWRDQLTASPIDLHEHHPRPTAKVHHPYAVNVEASQVNGKMPPAARKEPTLQKPVLTKLSLEVLAASHLGQRLPPMKSMTTIKSVQTPNQLIQILQYATHKINELHGTHVKHCKVLRLYNLSDFNADVKKVKSPALSDLAEHMETTPKSLKKWYTMYINAVIRKFDFDKFGDAKIKEYTGVFYGVDDIYELTEGSEKALEEYFTHVCKKVLSDAEKAASEPYNIFAETPGSKREKREETMASSAGATYNDNDASAIADTSFEEYKEDHEYKHPFDRNYARIASRFRELKSLNDPDVNAKLKGIKLCSTVKRIKRGTKDRMLCMVVGCEKHAQTRCDGCCTAHFRVFSSLAGICKKKSKQPLSNVPSATEMPLYTDFEPTEATSSNPLGKRKASESEDEVRPARDYSILNYIQAGSRVYVEWDADNELYRATVKKIIPDPKAPMAKIHYDGKKRHILDTIPLDMIHSFIEGENQPLKKQKQAHSEPKVAESTTTHENDDGLASDFPQLQKLYPGTVPAGESETMQSCPELGSGWQVHVVARKSNSINEGPRTDRYFISPSGKKFRSVPEVERYFWQNPIEFDALSSGKLAPELEDEVLDEECEEIAKINQDHSLGQPSAKPASYNPLSGKKPSNPNEDAVRSFITISPITSLRTDESHQSSMETQSGQSLPDEGKAEGVNTTAKPEEKLSKLSEMLQSPIRNPIRNVVKSPKEVTAVVKSAFSSSIVVKRPALHHKLYKSSTANRGHFPGMRSMSSAAQFQRNTAPARAAVGGGVVGRGRPKRKLKPVTRFEDEDSPERTPRSSAAPKVARVITESKSVLCHCAECEKGNLSVQGIYAHYGRAHTGTLSWHNVTYSCPFCPPGRAASRIFKSYHEAEAHVEATHPGCGILGPKPEKLSGRPGPGRPRQNKTPIVRQAATTNSDRVLREKRKASYESDEYDYSSYEEESDIDAPEPEDLGPPSWDPIEYAQLLPEGKKDYPREMWRVIDMIDQQRQVQGEIVEEARDQRAKLCKSESEMESRALDEERLLYQRGIRERTRMADGERIEKQKFTERAEEALLRYQYENRSKGRTKEEIEAEKLCSRPIKFSNQSKSSGRGGQACKDDKCQFCQKDKSYLHHLLLDHEVTEHNMDAPPTETPAFQQSTKVLDPSVRIINDEFFRSAEEAELKQTSGIKRVNQSRRDASTAKRVKTEEEKLWMLQNTKHSLGFIEKYNQGLILNSWGDIRKDTRNSNRRKSY